MAVVAAQVQVAWNVLPDLRPVFDKMHLPGGPWHRYRSRAWVDAIRIPYPWLYRRPSDGKLIPMDPAWVIWDYGTDDVTLMDPGTFSDTYEILD